MHAGVAPTDLLLRPWQRLVRGGGAGSAGRLPRVERFEEGVGHDVELEGKKKRRSKLADMDSSPPQPRSAQSQHSHMGTETAQP